MLFINQAVKEVLQINTRIQLADKLGVSTALISTWLQKDNDFCPRVGVAAKLYKHFGKVVYPYSVEALEYVNAT